MRFFTALTAFLLPLAVISVPAPSADPQDFSIQPVPNQDDPKTPGDNSSAPVKVGTQIYRSPYSGVSAAYARFFTVFHQRTEEDRLRALLYGLFQMKAIQKLGIDVPEQLQPLKEFEGKWSFPPAVDPDTGVIDLLDFRFQQPADARVATDSELAMAVLMELFATKLVSDLNVTVPVEVVEKAESDYNKTMEARKKDREEYNEMIKNGSYTITTVAGPVFEVMTPIAEADEVEAAAPVKTTTLNGEVFLVWTSTAYLSHKVPLTKAPNSTVSSAGATTTPEIEVALPTEVLTTTTAGAVTPTPDVVAGKDEEEKTEAEGEKDAVVVDRVTFPEVEAPSLGAPVTKPKGQTKSRGKSSNSSSRGKYGSSKPRFKGRWW